MKNDLFRYINNNFPNLSHEIHIRFELGDPYENGSDERINQVITRVTTIFEDLFNPEDYIYVYIKDWENREDPMFGDLSPNYIYDILKEHKIEEESMYEFDEDIDDMGKTIKIKHEYKVRIVYSQLKNIPYKEVLEGIGNYEQGREPSIGQSVNFISTSRDIIFNMYDDRGCIIFSNSISKLEKMYHKYNEWIVDYWRNLIDSLFMKA